MEIDRLKALPHYRKIIVLPMIGLAGAAFCRIFGGSYAEMAVTFVATFIGLFVRFQAVKIDFNPYLCIYFASLFASFVTGLAGRYLPVPTMEHASTACVLFLIPGVHFINSFSDFIDGNLLNGLIRGIHSLMISFAIALGLITTHLIYLP